MSSQTTTYTRKQIWVFNFTHILNELKKKHKITPSTFAKLLDVNPSEISRYKGGRVPALETQKKMAEILGISVDSLLQPTCPEIKLRPQVVFRFAWDGEVPKTLLERMQFLVETAKEEMHIKTDDLADRVKLARKKKASRGSTD
jgi:transcriptional regulator with XRE-family HTH domain